MFCFNTFPTHSEQKSISSHGPRGPAPPAPSAPRHRSRLTAPHLAHLSWSSLRDLALPSPCKTLLALLLLASAQRILPSPATLHKIATPVCLPYSWSLILLYFGDSVHHHLTYSMFYFPAFSLEYKLHEARDFVSLFTAPLLAPKMVSST